MWLLRRPWLLTALFVGMAACGTSPSRDTSASAAVPPRGAIAHALLMATQPVVLVPGTIDYTGKTDVTNALQNFLDHLPDNRTVLFHKNGRYRVDGTLYVTDRNGLTFDGQ